MPKNLTLFSFAGACVLLGLFTSSYAFSPQLPLSHPTKRLLPLFAAKNDLLKLTNNLSPSQIADLATEPNHSETRSGTWSESIQPDESYSRFIVEGEGSITLTSVDGETTRQRVTSGSLVEIKGDEGESQLLWDVDKEMVILYGGEMFDDNQKYAIGLLAVLAAACGLSFGL